MKLFFVRQPESTSLSSRGTLSEEGTAEARALGKIIANHVHGKVMVLTSKAFGSIETGQLLGWSLKIKHETYGLDDLGGKTEQVAGLITQIRLLLGRDQSTSVDCIIVGGIYLPEIISQVLNILNPVGSFPLFSEHKRFDRSRIWVIDCDKKTINFIRIPMVAVSSE